MEEIVKNEFQFYSKLARPLLLNLPKSRDRILAAAWIKKFGDENAGDEKLRTTYLKLILFCLQRRKLSGIFSDDPTHYEVLEELPADIDLNDFARNLIEQEKFERRELLMHEIKGDLEMSFPVFTTDCSPDLTEYVAAQDIPNFGVHAYYAISKQPVNKWQRSEYAIFPKGTKSTIDTSIVTSVQPKEAASASNIEEALLEQTSPATKTPERKKHRPKKLGTSPPSHPIGEVCKTVEDRPTPTWGTNLLKIKARTDIGQIEEPSETIKSLDQYVSQLIDKTSDEAEKEEETLAKKAKDMMEVVKEYKQGKMDKSKKKFPSHLTKPGDRSSVKAPKSLPPETIDSARHDESLPIEGFHLEEYEDIDYGQETEPDLPSFLYKDIEEDEFVVELFKNQIDNRQDQLEVSRYAEEFREASPAITRGIPLTTPQHSARPKRMQSPERLYAQEDDDLLIHRQSPLSPPKMLNKRVSRKRHTKPPLKDSDKDPHISVVFKEAKKVAKHDPEDLNDSFLYHEKEFQEEEHFEYLEKQFEDEFQEQQHHEGRSPCLAVKNQADSVKQRAQEQQRGLQTPPRDFEYEQFKQQFASHDVDLAAISPPQFVPSSPLPHQGLTEDEEFNLYENVFQSSGREASQLHYTPPSGGYAGYEILEDSQGSLGLLSPSVFATQHPYDDLMTSRVQLQNQQIAIQQKAQEQEAMLIQQDSSKAQSVIGEVEGSFVHQQFSHPLTPIDTGSPETPSPPRPLTQQEIEELQLLPHLVQEGAPSAARRAQEVDYFGGSYHESDMIWPETILPGRRRLETEDPCAPCSPVELQPYDPCSYKETPVAKIPKKRTKNVKGKWPDEEFDSPYTGTPLPVDYLPASPMRPQMQSASPWFTPEGIAGPSRRPTGLTPQQYNSDFESPLPSPPKRLRFPRAKRTKKTAKPPPDQIPTGERRIPSPRETSAQRKGNVETPQRHFQKMSSRRLFTPPEGPSESLLHFSSCDCAPDFLDELTPPELASPGYTQEGELYFPPEVLPAESPERPPTQEELRQHTFVPDTHHQNISHLTPFGYRPGMPHRYRESVRAFDPMAGIPESEGVCPTMKKPKHLPLLDPLHHSPRADDPDQFEEYSYMKAGLKVPLERYPKPIFGDDYYADVSVAFDRFMNTLGADRTSRQENISGGPCPAGARRGTRGIPKPSGKREIPSKLPMSGIPRSGIPGPRAAGAAGGIPSRLSYIRDAEAPSRLPQPGAGKPSRLPQLEGGKPSRLPQMGRGIPRRVPSGGVAAAPKAAPERRDAKDQDESLARKKADVQARREAATAARQARPHFDLGSPGGKMRPPDYVRAGGTSDVLQRSMEEKTVLPSYGHKHPNAPKEYSGPSPDFLQNIAEHRVKFPIRTKDQMKVMCGGYPRLVGRRSRELFKGFRGQEHPIEHEDEHLDSLLGASSDFDEPDEDCGCSGSAARELSATEDKEKQIYKPMTPDQQSPITSRMDRRSQRHHGHLLSPDDSPEMDFSVLNKRSDIFEEALAFEGPGMFDDHTMYEAMAGYQTPPPLSPPYEDQHFQYIFNEPHVSPIRMLEDESINLYNSLPDYSHTPEMLDDVNISFYDSLLDQSHTPEMLDDVDISFYDSLLDQSHTPEMLDEQTIDFYETLPYSSSGSPSGAKFASSPAARAFSPEFTEGSVNYQLYSMEDFLGISEPSPPTRQQRARSPERLEDFIHETKTPESRFPKVMTAEEGRRLALERIKQRKRQGGVPASKYSHTKVKAPVSARDVCRREAPCGTEFSRESRPPKIRATPAPRALGTKPREEPAQSQLYSMDDFFGISEPPAPVKHPHTRPSEGREEFIHESRVLEPEFRPVMTAEEGRRLALQRLKQRKRQGGDIAPRHSRTRITPAAPPTQGCGGLCGSQGTTFEDFLRGGPVPGTSRQPQEEARRLMRKTSSIRKIVTKQNR
ncbi:hypothetical protein ABEB36_009768 [Hypothenemus hampei]|uniref:DUF4485 domain-containing protein n=1 Tax=Hypothenemus hampei TaxID=57062 RepID=A0ABD1EHS7_HYPHA